MPQLEESFLKLVGIMDELREKCPWDKKQTIDTLRPLTIEETYELTDAITDHNWQHIKEELGDVLLHILFYAKIGSEQQQFTLQDVMEAISTKLINRHPHIYGDTKVNDEEDVKKNWEQIKMKEGKKSVLSGVPRSLPAIIKATRIQDKAKQVGFEWDNKEDVWKKVEEEMSELKEAVALNDQQHMKKSLVMCCLAWQTMHGFCRSMPKALWKKLTRNSSHALHLWKKKQPARADHYMI